MPIKPHTTPAPQTSDSDYISLERFSVTYRLYAGRPVLDLAQVVADIGFRPTSLWACYYGDEEWCEECRDCRRRGFRFLHSEGRDDILWKHTKVPLVIPYLSPRDWRLWLDPRDQKCEVVVVLTFEKHRR